MISRCLSTFVYGEELRDNIRDNEWLSDSKSSDSEILNKSSGALARADGSYFAITVTATATATATATGTEHTSLCLFTPSSTHWLDVDITRCLLRVTLSRIYTTHRYISFSCRTSSKAFDSAGFPNLKHVVSSRAVSETPSTRAHSATRKYGVRALHLSLEEQMLSLEGSVSLCNWFPPSDFHEEEEPDKVLGRVRTMEVWQWKGLLTADMLGLYVCHLARDGASI